MTTGTVTVVVTDAEGHASAPATASYAVTSSGPSVPSGYTLGTGSRGTTGRAWNLTTDEGWYKHTGTTISAAYYLPANITFGATGMRIRCSRNDSGHAYTSGEARWANGVGFVPDEHYMRFTARQEQAVILGDFPSWLWSRKQNGDGNGEIDYHETMANHIVGVTGATNTSLLGNKATMIKTPYDANQVNYSQGFNEPAAGTTELAFASSYHTFEVYKTLTDMTTYIDGVLHTVHKRGGTGGTGYPSNQNVTGMTGAIWDSQFASGGLWDLRISYQYGDGTNTGNAGTAQAFTGDRYLNVSELVMAVPA